MAHTHTHGKDEENIDHSRLKFSIKCQRIRISFELAPHWPGSLSIKWHAEHMCAYVFFLINIDVQTLLYIYVYKQMRGERVESGMVCGALRLRTTTTAWLFVHVQTGDGYQKLIACIETNSTRINCKTNTYNADICIYTYTVYLYFILVLFLLLFVLLCECECVCGFNLNPEFHHVICPKDGTHTNTHLQKCVCGRRK